MCDFISLVGFHLIGIGYRPGLRFVANFVDYSPKVEKMLFAAAVFRRPNLVKCTLTDYSTSAVTAISVLNCGNVIRYSITFVKGELVVNSQSAAVLSF